MYCKCLFAIYVNCREFAFQELHTGPKITMKPLKEIRLVKNPPAIEGDTGDKGSVPGSGRSPGEGNGNLLQYSCLGNPMDRGAWRATVHGVAKSRT